MEKLVCFSSSSLPPPLTVIRLCVRKDLKLELLPTDCFSVCFVLLKVKISINATALIEFPQEERAPVFIQAGVS